MKILLIASLLFFSTAALAEKHVNFELTGSKSDSQFAFTFDYNQPVSSEEITWASSIQSTSSRSKIKDPTLNETDSFRQLNWNNSWNYYDQWFFALGLGGSNTKLDEIKTQQVEITIGSDFHLGTTWNWSLAGGFNKISQDKAFGSLQKLTLNQRSLSAALDAQINDTYSAGLYFTTYRYEEDVNVQISRLSTPAAVQSYGTAFSDNLSSLPKGTVGLQIMANWSEKWSGSLGFSSSEDAPDPKAKSRSFDMSVKNQWNQNWDLGLSLASTQVDSTSTTDSARFSYIGFSIGYGWL